VKRGSAMLIIFGVRRRGHRLANVFAMCGVCHSPAAQGIVRVKTFFTLFFIPLIPIGTKYRSVCTMCGATSSLTREQADRAVAGAQQQAAQSAMAAAAPSPGVPVAGSFAQGPAAMAPPPQPGSTEGENPPVA
jgi:hypothetical protein